MRRAEEALRVLRPPRLPGGGTRVLEGLAHQVSAVVAAPAGSGKRDLGAVAALDALVSGWSWAVSVSPDEERAELWAARARRALEGSAWRDSAVVLSPGGDGGLAERVAESAGGRGWILASPQGLQDLLVECEPFRKDVLPGLGLAMAEGISDMDAATLLHLRHLLRLLGFPARLRGERMAMLLALDDAAAAAAAGEQFLPPSSLRDAERLVDQGQVPTRAVGWVVRPGSGPDLEDIQVMEETVAAPSQALRGVVEAVREATESGRWLALVDSAFMDPATAAGLESRGGPAVVRTVASPADLLAKATGADWRGTVSGAVLASESLHPAATARNLDAFLDADDASMVFVRPAGSALDPGFFFAGDPAVRAALDRGLSFASGRRLSEPVADFVGLMAMLVAADAGGDGWTMAEEELAETLGMPSEQARDVVGRLEEGGWVRRVRLENLPSAEPTGRLEVVAGANLEREARRRRVPVGCTAGERARLRCEGATLGEVDAFRAAAFLHQGKEVGLGGSVYRVTGALREGGRYDLELARAYEARLDLVGAEAGRHVWPQLEVEGLSSLEPTAPVRIHPDSTAAGETGEGEALLLIPLLEGGGLGVEPDAAWLSALVSYAGEVLLPGGLDDMRAMVGANERGQVESAWWDGEMTVRVVGHRFRQPRSAERGERRLAKPLEFTRRGPFLSVLSTLPDRGREALFAAARLLLPLQAAGLRDLALFHRAPMGAGPPAWRISG